MALSSDGVGAGESATTGGGSGAPKNKWAVMDLNTRLLEAVLAAAVNQVNRLLSEGASPWSRCRSSLVTACHLAALAGGPEALDLLLRSAHQQGGLAAQRHLVERRDCEGRQAHHLAASSGDLACLKSLLEASPELVNSIVTRNYPQEPVQEEHFDSFLHPHHEVQFMLPLFTEGSTALHIASQYGQLSVVEYLIDERKADISLKDSAGHSAFDVIGTLRSVDPTHEFFWSGVEEPAGSSISGRPVSGSESRVSTIPRLSEGGSSMRSLPERLGSARNAKALLTCLRNRGGAPSKHPSVRTIQNMVRAAYESGSTGELLDALEWYQENKLLWVLELPDEKGRLPLHIAVSLLFKDGLQLLLKYSPDSANHFDEDGHTPLHLAVLAEWAEGVSLLLAVTDLDKHPSAEKETVLHIAAPLASCLILRMLLSTDSKSMLERRDWRGRTALMRLTEARDVPPGEEANYRADSEEWLRLWCFRSLREGGPGLRTADLDGDTLLHIAAAAGRINVLKALSLQGGDWPRWYNGRGLSPLHAACLDPASSQCLSLLLESCTPQDACLPTEPPACETALHLAARAGNSPAVELLLASRAGAALLSSHDASLRQPIILAAASGSKDCVLMLLRSGADLASRVRVSHFEKDSALDLISFKIPDSVALMNQLLDSYVKRADSQEREDSSHFELLLDFTIFLPVKRSKKETKKVVNFTYGAASKEVRLEDGQPLDLDKERGCRRQMRVVSAIVKCKHEAMRASLLLHPLTESFIIQKWLHLRRIHYAVFVLFALHIVSLVGLGLGFSSYSNRVFIGINILLPAITIIVEVIIVQSLRKPRQYVEDLENWLKWSVILTSLALSGLALGGAHPRWLRALNSLAVLLAFAQVLFLFGKSPGRGLWVFIHFKVAAKVLHVLWSFLFLILGFACAFLILFNGQYPFNDAWSAFSKVIIMMVELDYNGVYTSDANPDPNQSIDIFGRILYIAFVITVVLSVTNLMFGISVSNVDRLVKAGRSLFLAKTASFIATLEKVVETLGLLRRFTLPEEVLKVWPNERRKKVRTVGQDGRISWEDNDLQWTIKRALLKKVVKDLKDDDETDSITE